MIRWIATGLVLVAGQSQAMINCSYTDEMVISASVVVQIENPSVSAPDSAGYCQVSGVIAHAFRGAETGNSAGVPVPCDNVDDIVGPTAWTDFAALAVSPVIEIYIDDTGQVAGCGVDVAHQPVR